MDPVLLDHWRLSSWTLSACWCLYKEGCVAPSRLPGSPGPKCKAIWLVKHHHVLSPCCPQIHSWFSRPLGSWELQEELTGEKRQFSMCSNFFCSCWLLRCQGWCYRQINNHRMSQKTVVSRKMALTHSGLLQSPVGTCRSSCLHPRLIATGRRLVASLWPPKMDDCLSEPRQVLSLVVLPRSSPRSLSEKLQSFSIYLILTVSLQLLSLLPKYSDGDKAKAAIEKANGYCSNLQILFLPTLNPIPICIWERVPHSLCPDFFDALGISEKNTTKPMGLIINVTILSLVQLNPL